MLSKYAVGLSVYQYHKFRIIWVDFRRRIQIKSVYTYKFRWIFNQWRELNNCSPDIWLFLRFVIRADLPSHLLIAKNLALITNTKILMIATFKIIKQVFWNEFMHFVQPEYYLEYYPECVIGNETLPDLDWKCPQSCWFLDHNRHPFQGRGFHRFFYQKTEL